MHRIFFVIQLVKSAKIKRRIQVLHNMAMRAALGKSCIVQQIAQSVWLDINYGDVLEGCVTGSKSPYKHGDRRTRVTIIRRSINLARADEVDKRPGERASATTKVIGHSSGIQEWQQS
jgi:hypothetical protein